MTLSPEPSLPPVLSKGGVSSRRLPPDTRPANAAGAPPPVAPLLPRPDLSLSRIGRWGAAVSLLLLAILLLWAWVTPIGGAVIASGQAVVRGKPKLVQSLDGGIVQDILVEEGQRVEQGQLLLRLDATLLQANLDISLARLGEALARRARLASEQTELAAPAFPPPTLPFPAPAMAANEEGQRQIFATRRALEIGRHDQLAERVAQLGHQIGGQEALLAAQGDQLAILDRQIATQTELLTQGLTRESQLLEIQRARAALLGDMASSRAEIARLRNEIRNAEIELAQRDREFHEQVATDLRATAAEADELVVQIVNTRAELGRVEIRAPAAGVVHELQTTTRGGVAAAGAELMKIVPLAEGVEFEMRLDPRLIEQVHPGQKAQVVFPALDQRETPRLAGEVTRISPGTMQDPVLQTEYYQVLVSVPPEQIALLKGAEIPPGMPVEAFLERGERTVMDYLLHPLAAQIEHGFRER